MDFDFGMCSLAQLERQEDILFHCLVSEPPDFRPFRVWIPALFHFSYAVGRETVVAGWMHKRGFVVLLRLAELDVAVVFTFEGFYDEAGKAIRRTDQGDNLFCIEDGIARERFQGCNFEGAKIMWFADARLSAACYGVREYPAWDEGASIHIPVKAKNGRLCSCSSCNIMNYTIKNTRALTFQAQRLHLFAALTVFVARELCERSAASCRMVLA